MSDFDADSLKFSGKEYENPEVIRHLYWEKGWPISKIADAYDVSTTPIYSRMKKHDIERRSRKDAHRREMLKKPAPFMVGSDGYEYWQTRAKGEHWSVYHHRLLATLKCDLSEMAGKSVHHKNGVKWDNRLENLEIVTPHEHHNTHSDNEELREPGEDNPLVECACGCGGKRPKYDSDGRRRYYINPHQLREANGEMHDV
jgi:hypothetical protein